MEDKYLPRLLYIGDVPVESTVAGSALLYRLLQEYSRDNLCIVEGNIVTSDVQKRLPDVTYRTFSVGYKRLLSSRLVFLYTSYLVLTARWRFNQLTNLINDFQPEAIITVAHGLSWITAAATAKKHNLPLHLIVHDEWTSYTAVVSPLKNTIKKIFGDIYSQANSRLCVSPYMNEFYEKQYGVKGTVLYPSRAKDISVLEQQVVCKTNKKSNSLVVAYAGSINSNAYADSLVSLAKILHTTGDRLVIYSPLSLESIEKLGLSQTNISTHSLIPSEKLIYTLREEADVLFVPMSFDQQDRPNMEMSFPSKLTDYTAIGLPLLIWGPTYCSAVRWAKANFGVAEVVDSQELAVLADSVKKLTENSEYRFKLATNSLKIGFDYFSHSKAIQQFYQSIAKKERNSLC